MAVLYCPICRSPVRAQHVDAKTCLYCKKCLTPFHRNKDGDVVVGHPHEEHGPDEVERNLEDLKQTFRDLWRRIPVKRIVAVLVVGVFLMYHFWPAERLERTAQRAGQAFARGDEDYLESIAAPGTAADIARWFNETHPRFVQRREGWYAPTEVIEVQVMEEDRSHGRGLVGVSIHPGGGVSLDNPAAATAAAPSPFNFVTVWTQSRRGRWVLHGRDTNARSHP